MRKTLVVLTSFLIQLCSYHIAFAQEFFGGSDIDYWNEGVKPMTKTRLLVPTSTPKLSVPIDQSLAPTGSVIRQMDSKPFDWKNYEDPKSDAFWDEGGDYIPPRPFRVVAADPTPENVAKLVHWMQKKMSLTLGIETAIKNQAVGVEPRVLPKKWVSETKKSGISWKKMQIVYFYQTTCPHCQKNLPVVYELKRLGVQVMPVQLDWKTNPPLLAGSVKYDAELEAARPITATPTWLISYQGVVTEIQGETSPDDIAARVSK